MSSRPRVKRWEVGDLVLREDAPKTFALLMEIIEIKGNAARLRYLDGNPGVNGKPAPKGLSRPHKVAESGVWVPLETLADPAVYLRTQQFAQALHDHILSRKAGNQDGKQPPFEMERSS